MIEESATDDVECLACGHGLHRNLELLPRIHFLERLYHLAFVSLDVFSKKLDILSVNPSTHIPLRKHNRAVLLKQGITRNVVDVIVRVDDKLHRLPGDLADLRENLLRPLERKSTGSVDVDEAVDDDDSVIAYDEARIS